MVYLDDQLLEHIRHQCSDESLSLLQNNKYFGHLIDSDRKSTLLRHAAECGNTDFVQHLIKLRVGVNAQNSYGQTALMLAVQNYHRPMVKLLLQSGANMFIIDKKGEHFLKKINFDTDVRMSIIRHENFKTIISELLNEGNFIKSKAFYKDCPLYNFMSAKNIKLTRILLKNGSPVNATHPTTKTTALHMAVRNLDLAHIKLLINYGANVNARDSLQNRPLAYIPDIKTDKNMKIVQILIEASTTFPKQAHGERIMETILPNANVQIIKAIMQTNIDLHAKIVYDMTPLDYIFLNRNPEVYEVLRNFNIDLNKCPNDKNTVLHRVVSSGNENALQYLLEFDFNVNVKDCYGRTPLCMAIDPYRGGRTRWDCMKILFHYGADPQIWTNENYNHIGILHDPLVQFNWINGPSVRHFVIQILRPIFAELALYEVSGRKIDSFMLRQIKNCKEFQKVYDDYKKELERMMKIKIVKSLSLFDFMMTKKLAIFTEDKKLMANLNNHIKNYDSNSIYHYKLQTLFIKLEKIIAIEDFFLQYYDVSVTNISGKIVDYLYCKFFQ